MILGNLLVKQFSDSLSAKLHKSSQDFCIFFSVMMGVDLVGEVEVYHAWIKN